MKTSPQANKTVSFLTHNPPLYSQSNYSSNAQIYTQSNYSLQNQTQSTKSFANPQMGKTPPPPLDPHSDPNQIYQEYCDLFQSHQQILLKCSKLEESLRNETINSEEQRSYIEILKQALEEKLITNELWNDVKVPQPQSPVDFYLEMMKMKQNMDQKEQDFNEIMKSFEETKEHLESLISQNQELEKTQVKLTEEKESLLEYLDELKENFMRIEQQNQQYESLISSLKREKDEMKSYFEDLKPQLEEKIEENARMSEDLQSEKALFHEIEGHRQKLLERNEELETEINDLKSNDFKKEITNLRNEISSLSQEKNTLMEKLRISNENFSTVKCTLQETQSDLDKALEKSNTLNEELQKYKEFQNNYQDLELKHLALQEEFDNLSQGKKEEITRIENERQRKMDEIKGVYQQLSQNRTEIRNLKEELSKMENERGSYNQNLETLTQQNAHQKAIISNFESEIQEYKKILQERDLSSAKLHTLTIKYQADKEFYEDSLKEFRRKNNDLTQENETILRELHQIKEKTQVLEENLEKASNKNPRNHSMSMEQAFKYVNSMIMDLKRHLGNTKLTRNNEKFDLESSLLELHELIIMCLERFEEINSNSFSKRQFLEEKEQEIRSLQEKVDSYEQNFERNIGIFEKEKEELAHKFENEHKEIVQEMKKQEEINRKLLENEVKFENELIKESCNKLKKEKACFEYLLKRIKAVFLEEEGKKLIDELAIITFEILELEIKKTELQVKLEQITQQKLKDNYYDLNNLKENLYDVQRNLERYYEKKKNLENELQKMEFVDKKKSDDSRDKVKRMIKTNSESNLRAIFEETRGTDNSLVSNRNFESKLSSIKDEKAPNKPQIYRDFSSSKYVSYQDKFEKAGSLYEKSSNFSYDVNPVYNNLNELRNKFAKKGWKAGGLSYYEENK